LFLLSRIGAAKEEQISGRPVPDEPSEFLLCARERGGTLSLIVLVQQNALRAAALSDGRSLNCTTEAGAIKSLLV